MEHGVNVIATDEDKRSVLHHACTNHNHVMVKALLEHESLRITHLESLDSHGQTPMAALFMKSPEDDDSLVACLKLLLDAGANPDVHFRANPLDYSRSGFAVSSDTSLQQNVTPLIVAIAHRDRRAIAQLLGHDTNRASINLADESGISPFLHAVKTNDANIVIQLLNADGRAPDDDDFAR